MTLRRVLLASLLAGLPMHAVQAQAPAVAVTGAWVRATAPHQDEAAAYMTLTSRAADTLLEVTSQQAGMAMLHTTAHDGGVMRMRDADSLDLPAGQAVTLSPGGTHVMLGGLSGPLKPGQTVTLSLRFSHAPPLTVEAQVLPIGARGPAAGAAP